MRTKTIHVVTINWTRGIDLSIFRLILICFLLTRERPATRMIRAMHLPVTIHTTAVNGPDIQSLSGTGRMAWQHMNVALLAHQVSTSRQKLGIVRTMRRMTVQAILADGWMIPEKWTTFFGMAGVAEIIDGKLP